MKYSIQRCISINLTGIAIHKIHFLGLQNNEPNPEAILSLAERMFKSKRYSTGRVLHTIIRLIIASMKKYN
jgi:hypothetical protein